MGVEQGEGGPSFEEGKGSMGNFVDGQVFPYVSLRCSPHEGLLAGLSLTNRRRWQYGDL